MSIPKEIIRMQWFLLFVTLFLSIIIISASFILFYQSSSFLKMDSFEKIFYTVLICVTFIFQGIFYYYNTTQLPELLKGKWICINDINSFYIWKMNQNSIILINDAKSHFFQIVQKYQIENIILEIFKFENIPLEEGKWVDRSEYWIHVDIIKKHKRAKSEFLKIINELKRIE